MAGGGAGSRAGGDAAVLGRPARLAAVERARRLLSTSGLPLDRIARLAAAGGRAPVGVISLLDAEREYLVAAHGTPCAEIPASESLCQHVVNADLPLVIDDLDGAEAGRRRGRGAAADRRHRGRAGGRRHRHGHPGGRGQVPAARSGSRCR